MNYIIALREGLRIFKRAQKIKMCGVKQYKGSAESICQQIIEDCWNDKYFMVSNGHFCEFYMRDFGWCVDSLIKLGYRERCLKTIGRALEQYEKAGRLTTTITPDNKVIDVFSYSPDTLGYLLRTLRQLDAKNLVKKHQNFIKREVKRFFNLVIDKETGLVRKDRYFSSMKDHAKRKSACYDNCFAAVISECLHYFELDNPFGQWNYKKLIKDNFWKEYYFLDDLSGDTRVAGDANTFPFWLGVIDDKDMLKNSIKTMQENELDKPFPLKYERGKNAKLNFADKLVSDYETNAIWVHMAFPYIEIVSRVDKEKAKEYLDSYKALIEKHKNFLEVYTDKGEPFMRTFYASDEGMLWAANWLWPSKRMNIRNE